MGCAPINKQVKPFNEESIDTGVVAGKLPREVLEGFNRVLKSVVKKPEHGKNEIQIKKAEIRKDLVGKEEVKLQQAKNERNFEEGKEKENQKNEEIVAPEGNKKREELGKEEQVLIEEEKEMKNEEDLRKKQSILRTSETKVTVKSELKVNFEEKTAENKSITDEPNKENFAEKSEMQIKEDVDQNSEKEIGLLHRKQLTKNNTIQDYDFIPSDFIKSIAKPDDDLKSDEKSDLSEKYELLEG